MFKKINFILVLLLLLMSVGAVSAADDFNETIGSEEAGIDEVSSDDVLTSSDAEEIVSSDEENEVLTSNSHNITKYNYASYFSSKGELTSSSVKQGDTINLQGDFEKANFIFRIPVNIIGVSNEMKKTTVTLYSGASGSTISNLNIANTDQYAYGIFLNGASNCVVKNCFINNTGASSYAMCIGNDANYNNVINNSFHNYGITYGHGTRSTTPVLISGSHYNHVANNDISCWDANAIYLSSYDGGPLNGGVSNFNVIYNNSIKYCVVPTSWSYGIQLMGSNNTVNNNRIVGAYRGISSSGSGNIIINNKIINLTGADFSRPDVTVGGDVGIVGSYNSLVINNTIEHARVTSTGCGISVLDNSIIQNNTVEIISRGVGIRPQGSNIIIEDNNVSTVSGSGILYDTHSFNLTVRENYIFSKSGVGILIQKLSSKKMPGNITIVNNYVIAGNENIYAIDARGADSSTNNLIDGNAVPKGYGKIATPEGVFDSSKIIYRFDGNTYNITPENIWDYIEEDGKFKVIIKDGDNINFEGSFNLNLAIVINSAIKIDGKNAQFYNTTFKVSSDGVWLENLYIRNANSSRLNAWGVLVNGVSAVTIKDCDIDVYDKNAAYAVYVVESSDVDVIHNNLSSKGDYLTYTLLAHTVEDCRFINNTINTVGTGKIYINSGGELCLDGNESCLDGDESCLDGDENTGCLDGNENSGCVDGNENCVGGSESCLDGNCFDGNHVVRGIFRTYGIVILYSSGNEVRDNKINATSQLNTTIKTNQSTNTVIGIDLYYNVHDNVVSNNEIYVKANDNYIYGVGVLGWMDGHDAPIGHGATNNQFINNKITLDGSYFVQGIVIGDESEDTIIVGNDVYAKSDNVAYGINLEMSQQSNIDKNTFILNSDIVYGIEAVASNNNLITNNSFEINAKQAYGFAFTNSNYNNFTLNVVFANGTDEEITFKNFDSIPGGNAGIYLKSHSTNNTIIENTITSIKGYAIILDDVTIDNVIYDNYLDSELGIGNHAVNNTSNNSVKENYKYYVTGEIEELSIIYLKNGTIVFKTTDDDLEGATVKFYDIEKLEIGSSILSDGKAELNYNFPNEIPGSSCVYVMVSKENYKTQEFMGIMYIEKGNLTLILDNVWGAIARNAKFTAVIKNIFGEGVEGITVEFTVVDEGYPQYIGKAVSDKDGFVTLIGAIPQIYDEHPIILGEIKENSYFHAVSNRSNLTAYRLTSTNIVVNTNVYPNGVLAILKDEKGNVLANKEISIDLNGKKYNLVTDSSGSVKMPIISKGTYLIYLFFEGDDNYYSSKNSNKIAINPSIVENKNYVAYYGNKVKYSVRIIDSNGKYAAAGHVVVIKVNGKTYNVKTDKNGYATVYLKFKVGSYTITSEYNGDKVSNKITFKPTLIAKNVVVKKSKKVKFTVKLLNKNGKILKKKKVTFKVKGKKYSAKTNRKGVATVFIKNLKVGKYKISSSYGGCTIYNTLKIKK